MAWQVMLIFGSPVQKVHAPSHEIVNGKAENHAETPQRFDSVLAQVSSPVRAPADHGLAPILAVHEADYLAFLQSAFGEWRVAGRDGDAIGYAFPVRARRRLALARIDAKLGQFGFDAVTPIAAGTWEAAYWGAQAALGGIAAIAAGEARQAFALCRPPGHHAGADYFGGYCYLNNAAIAARAAIAAGMGPVAVLDVDYHHGNGTQDIFYADGSVLFVSIHADPRTDFPFFWGHAQERGAGAGEGANLNLPLPRGTVWRAYAGALAKALEAIAAFGARMLIVSYGADTLAGDPIAHFALTRDDMARMGAAIARLGLPTLTVLEGGYDVPALGDNVAAFLAGLESA
ncbi:histone deacetylase family protein [Erythrobacter tepidarius]|uniref:histone deacetylase family protein n=1 Tax=Erythrobacter tepidarius TaxID=60454 RepID=UPI002481A744|nr:histone deacetylase family protein [Erythrobacter tepidarius]